jgi:Protein of unknown function (DUF2848)
VEALEKHICELQALGVKRPKSIPIFYRVAADLLTTSDCGARPERGHHRHARAHLLVTQQHHADDLSTGQLLGANHVAYR